VTGHLKKNWQKSGQVSSSFTEFDITENNPACEDGAYGIFATENILLKILPFKDDFERALKNMEDAKIAMLLRRL
jgi:molecular chaperone GrpE (heat shock protein)